jgi:hypothetical protein
VKSHLRDRPRAEWLRFPGESEVEIDGDGDGDQLRHLGCGASGSSLICIHTWLRLDNARMHR